VLVKLVGLCWVGLQQLKDYDFVARMVASLDFGANVVIPRDTSVVPPGVLSDRFCVVL
jgi:hypothetical protein